MPSGAEVTAIYSCFSYNDCFLDVTVYPLTEDSGHSEGLCGNYNGDPTDDRTTRNSNVVDTDSEPVLLAASYMYERPSEILNIGNINATTDSDETLP